MMCNARQFGAVAYEIDFGIILLYMYVRNQLAIGHPAAVTIVSAVRNIAANVTNLLARTDGAHDDGFVCDCFNYELNQ